MRISFLLFSFALSKPLFAIFPPVVEDEKRVLAGVTDEGKECDVTLRFNPDSGDFRGINFRVLNYTRLFSWDDSYTAPHVETQLTKTEEGYFESNQVFNSQKDRLTTLSVVEKGVKVVTEQGGQIKSTTCHLQETIVEKVK